MKSRTKVKLLAVIVTVLTLGLIASACSSDEVGQEGPALGKITGMPTIAGQSPEPGKPAPDFEFEDPEGQASSLSDLQGKPVLLNFWATWCGPCVHEMPFLQEIYNEWTDKGLVLLAIDIGEGPTVVKQFLQERGFSFPVILDTERAVATKYNIRGVPTTFLINEDGVIEAYKVGAFQSKEEIEAGIKMVIP
jgi:thiol-disulfide isomerase/thioredoxin